MLVNVCQSLHLRAGPGRQQLDCLDAHKRSIVLLGDISQLPGLRFLNSRKHGQVMASFVRSYFPPACTPLFSLFSPFSHSRNVSSQLRTPDYVVLSLLW